MYFPKCLVPDVGGYLACAWPLATVCAWPLHWPVSLPGHGQLSVPGHWPVQVEFPRPGSQVWAPAAGAGSRELGLEEQIWRKYIVQDLVLVVFLEVLVVVGDGVGGSGSAGGVGGFIPILDCWKYAQKC